jgi:hypothetical protein
MRKTIIITIMVLAFVTGYSKEIPQSTRPDVKKYFTELPAKLPADACLQAALNAQANAFGAEQIGHDLCAASVTNGSLPPSEYNGCCYAFTLIRQITVAYIQSTFVPCPSGQGTGII